MHRLYIIINMKVVSESANNYGDVTSIKHMLVLKNLWENHNHTQTYLRSTGETSQSKTAQN